MNATDRDYDIELAKLVEMANQKSELVTLTRNFANEEEKSQQPKLEWVNNLSEIN
jgi:hypothetical protein